MYKKLISIFVAAMLILSIIPAAALASNAARSSSPATEKSSPATEKSSPATEKDVAWDFETDPEAQGFTFLDQDGDNHNWYWHMNTGYGNYSAHSGDGVAASESYNNDSSLALTPDNWMLTPAFTGGSISFWMIAQDPSYSNDFIGVYVSTDGGSTWSDELFGQMTPTSYQQFTVDLSAYDGQTINVAFRHYNSYDMFIAVIDDIEVSGDVVPVDPTEPPADPTEPPVTPEPVEGLIAGYYFESEDELEGWSWVGVFDTEWVHSNNNPGGYDYASFAHEGSGFIMSYSFVDYVGAYQADNWAITPAVTLPEGSARLSFYATNANVAYPEAFDVYIGTSDETAEMTLLQGNISPNTGYDDPWTHYEIDISDYAGQTVYVGFYDHCYDMYEIWLDQVEFFGEGGQTPVDPTEPPVDPTEPPVQHDLDEALNVEGGELHFESEGDYPWTAVEEGDRIYAMNGNTGVSSSDSILTTTITANAGDVVTFEFKAWGEGTNTYWDYCEFAIDGERVGYWGAYQNDWEAFTSEPLTAGEHTLTWKYHKDSSVNPNGDYFMVDNVEITEGELPPSGIIGDVDMDGDVDTADALLALRYVLELESLNEDQLAQAEVDGDGEVTIVDALLILRVALGLLDGFPTEG